tara:strand:+ start:681 stop:1130 length:450 start_codon:yes stop_codon:yes gene_type:complete
MIVDCLTRQQLEKLWGADLLLPSEKGYPQIFDNMDYWVLFVDDIPVAYTGSLILDEFAFVGNTYVKKKYRKNKYHPFLLSERNNSALLSVLPKITILNPIEEVKMSMLVKTVLHLGYHKVCSYYDVQNIMSLSLYEDILDESQQIWRMD